MRRVGVGNPGELVAVAADAKHRMRRQTDLVLALGEFAHHRVDQERHVVVDDLDHRHELVLAGLVQPHGFATDFRRAWRARGDKVEGALGQRGEFDRVITHHVFRHRALVELRHEAGRNFLAAAVQHLAGFGHGGVSQGLFVAAWKVAGHGILVRSSRVNRPPQVFTFHPRGSREQGTNW